DRRKSTVWTLARRLGLTTANRFLGEPVKCDRRREVVHELGSCVWFVRPASSRPSRCGPARVGSVAVEAELHPRGYWNGRPGRGIAAVDAGARSGVAGFTGAEAHPGLHADRRPGVLPLLLPW